MGKLKHDLNNCLRKIAYRTFEQAMIAMKVTIKKDPLIGPHLPKRVYKCKHCRQFHWGRYNPNKKQE